MFIKSLFSTAASAALLFSGHASAIELVNLENVPSQYASMQEVTDTDTGETVEELKFGQRNYIWKADSLNRILTGYGLELTEENAAGTPKGFCKVVEVVNDEGEVDQVMLFNKANSTIYTPNTLNNILNAYGVELDVENEEALENVPNIFANVLEQENEEGEMEKVVQFGNDNITWNPEKFNAILAAYN